MSQTLDFTKEAFESQPSAKTAQAYLETVHTYFNDDMVRQATVDTAEAKLSAWCAETGISLTDPATSDDWTASTGPQPPLPR